jgi:hypothetical protein
VANTKNGIPEEFDPMRDGDGGPPVDLSDSLEDTDDEAEEEEQEEEEDPNVEDEASKDKTVPVVTYDVTSYGADPDVEAFPGRWGTLIYSDWQHRVRRSGFIHAPPATSPPAP